jgi:hypothetical protein
LANEFDAVAAKHDEIREPIVGVALHNVPDDWAPADFHHGLWSYCGFFTKPCSDATREYNYFHRDTLLIAPELLSWNPATIPNLQ